MFGRHGIPLRHLRFALLIVFAGIASVHAADQQDEGAAPVQQWGHLTGRFVYDGERPEPVRIVPNKDVAAFTEPIYSERLVVNEENRGVGNLLLSPEMFER